MINYQEKFFRNFSEIKFKNDVYTVMRKHNGVTITCVYEGDLVGCYTGYDETNRVKIKNLPVPKTITDKTIKYVRGELIFKKNSKSRCKSRSCIQANVHNLDERFVDATFIPTLILDKGGSHDTQLDKLASLGFYKPESLVVLPDEIMDVVELLDEEEYPYDTDGYIFTLDDLTAKQEVIIYNPYGKSFVREIEDITYKLMYNGVLMPIATIKPLIIDDMEFKHVRAENLGVGSVIKVRRSSDFSISIKEVVRRKKITKNPICICGGVSTKKVSRSGNVYYRCENDCKRLLILLTRLFDKEHINVKIGIRKLNSLKLTNVHEILEMSEEDFVERLGKSGSKIYRDIRNRRGIEFYKILDGFISTRHAKKITMDDFDNLNIRGMGEETRDDIIDWYEENKDSLQKYVDFFKPTFPKTKETYYITGEVRHPHPHKMMEEKGMTLSSYPDKIVVGRNYKSCEVKRGTQLIGQFFITKK